MRKESFFIVKKIRQKDLYSLKKCRFSNFIAVVHWSIHMESHISGLFSVSLPWIHGINPIKFILPNKYSFIYISFLHIVLRWL